MKEALQRLDTVIAELIEADQTANGIDPLRVAQQLGHVRALLLQGPAVVPRAGGERHFRCETCGTIWHGQTPPAKCPTCGGSKFFNADLEMPVVDAGPA